MKSELNAKYLSISRVAMLMNVSTTTIQRWYRWWEAPGFEKPSDLSLPKYVHCDRRKTKFFLKEDIPALREFQRKLSTTHRGVMSEFNAAYQWGKLGSDMLERKGTTAEAVKNRMYQEAKK